MRVCSGIEEVTDEPTRSPDCQGKRIHLLTLTAQTVLIWYGNRLHSLTDVIHQHRAEHARKVLISACQEAIQILEFGQSKKKPGCYSAHRRVGCFRLPALVPEGGVSESASL